MTVCAFVTGVVLHLRFDLWALNRITLLVKNADGAAGHFYHVAFFQEDKAAGYRQQGQLVGSNEVLAHATANHQRAT
ncbi:hypothetical protein D3C78_1486790 [compost metagenome]